MAEPKAAEVMTLEEWARAYLLTLPEDYEKWPKMHEAMAAFARKLLEEAAQIAWHEACPECGHIARMIRRLAGKE